MHGILTSLSGMLNALRRSNITAHNIANSQTTGFRTLQATSAEVAGGGVKISGVTETPGIILSDVTLPNGTANLLSPSNVDLTTEATNLLINKNAFQANLQMLKAQDETLGTILDIID